MFRQLAVVFIFLTCVLLSCNGDYILKDVNVAAVDGEHVRIFTKEAMQSYDGSDETRPIYMGIKGVVFDVSTGKRFYGKGSPYNSLVGKDCTKAVAKMSLDEKDLTHDIKARFGIFGRSEISPHSQEFRIAYCFDIIFSDLTANDLKMLDETFEGTYVAKYPVVGYMDYFRDQHPEKFSNVKTEL